MDVWKYEIYLFIKSVDQDIWSRVSKANEWDIKK